MKPGSAGCLHTALPPPRNIMRDFLRIVAVLVAAYIVSPQVCGAEAPALTGLVWHGFPDTAKFGVRGLPWFAENSPKLLADAGPGDGVPAQGRAGPIQVPVGRPHRDAQHDLAAGGAGRGGQRRQRGAV